MEWKGKRWTDCCSFVQTARHKQTNWKQKKRERKKRSDFVQQLNEHSGMKHLIKE